MSEGTNDKGHGGEPVPFEKNTTNGRNFSKKSTATEDQYERAEALLSSGDKNTIELRRCGVMMPSDRIEEMVEKLGYDIQRVALSDFWDEWGFLHKRVAVHRLISAPGVTQ
jgi:hypothetical protein